MGLGYSSSPLYDPFLMGLDYISSDVQDWQLLRGRPSAEDVRQGELGVLWAATGQDGERGGLGDLWGLGFIRIYKGLLGFIGI